MVFCFHHWWCVIDGMCFIMSTTLMTLPHRENWLVVSRNSKLSIIVQSFIIFIIVPGIRMVNILKTPSRKNHEASGQKMTKVAGHGWGAWTALHVRPPANTRCGYRRHRPGTIVPLVPGPFWRRRSNDHHWSPWNGRQWLQRGYTSPARASSLIGRKKSWEGHAVPIPNMTIYDHINNFSEPWTKWSGSW